MIVMVCMLSHYFNLSCEFLANKTVSMNNLDDDLALTHEPKRTERQMKDAGCDRINCATSDVSTIVVSSLPPFVSTRQHQHEHAKILLHRCETQISQS